MTLDGAWLGDDAFLAGLNVHLTLCRILAKHGYTEADFEIVFLENIAAVQTAFIPTLLLGVLRIR